MSAEFDLAESVRKALAGAGPTQEIRMFGGIGFMLNGNMVVGVMKDGLLVRVGKDGYDEALRQPGAGPMQMGDRTLGGFVLVDNATLTVKAVARWVDLALDFVRALPPKAAGGKRPRKNANPA